MIEKRRIGQTKLRVNTLGFGCAPLGNLYHTLEDTEAQAVLNKAWDKGFRYFDTAPHYGQGLSEHRVGNLLRTPAKKEYILSTKVGRLLKPAGYAKMRHLFHSPMPFDISYNYTYDGIMRSYEDSLQRLGLDRIDILFMHDIGAATHGENHKELFRIAMSEGYQAMDELRRNALVTAIGLGVNEYQVCELAMQHGDWDCFLLAGRYTLLEQEALHSFLPACERRNCSVIIGSPYNSGILAGGVRRGGTLYYNYAPASKTIIERVKCIENCCLEFDVPIAAAALQFPLFHPAVASVIPGIDSVDLVARTRRLLQIPIPVEFWQKLRALQLLEEQAPTAMEKH